MKLSNPIDIVLVSWHRPKMTELVIKAIHANTKPESYRLIVIDNGSRESQRDMLKDLHDNGYIDELVQFDTNHGLEYARNHAMKLIQSDHFICADNDCLPEPISDGTDWIEKLYTIMESNSGLAAVSARTQVMIGTGNIFDGHEEEDLVEFPHPGGSFRMMLTEAVEDVGGWRTDSAGRGSEERYICGKLHEIGYRTAFAVRVKCLHLFGVREQKTDRWGYPVEWKPEDTGHSDIWHPSLQNGDDFEEVKKYVGEKHAVDYFKA